MNFSDMRRQCAQFTEISDLDPPDFDPAMVRPMRAILYDPLRFRTEVDRNDLLRQIRQEHPEISWHLRASSKEVLPVKMQSYTPDQARKFENEGFVLETSRPNPKTGTPKRTAFSLRAWEAYLANVVVAEAILEAWEINQNPGTNKRDRMRGGIFPRGGVFGDLRTDVVALILGSFHDNDHGIGTKLLVERHGLLVSPCTFRTATIGYSTDNALTYNSASMRGRQDDILRQWTSDSRGTIRTRIRKEIAAWARHLGDEFSIDGLVLMAAQTLALLRIQAAEWRIRDKTDYAASGRDDDQPAREYAAETKQRYVQERLSELKDGLTDYTLDIVNDDSNIPDDLKQELEAADYDDLPDLFARTGRFIPDMRPFPVNPELEAYSFLAGGIGLQPEFLIRMDGILRQSLTYKSFDLVKQMASWIGRLRRFHREILTATMAPMIRRIIVNQRREIAEFDIHAPAGTATDILRTQFTDEVWNGLLNAVEMLRRDEIIAVEYRWNGNPIEPARLVEEKGKLVIYGSLLGLTHRSHDWWAERAALFREQASLTI